MGRLILNVLLSFAQFEREVTAEQIRDKIAASKRKGLWMGSLPPTGYDCRDRVLVVNAPEAVTVGFIYQRYLELGSVADLKSDLEARGIVSKLRPGQGGTPMQRGALYRLLSNPLYRGQIAHKDQIYPGQHPAIIDDDLWQAVQSRLMQSRVDSAVRPKAAHAGLLTGLAFDANGDRLTPTHAVKDNKRYRHYISRPLTIASKSARTESLRLPALELELEREVTRQLCRQLRDRKTLGEHLMADQPSVTTLKARMETLDTLATQWSDLPAAHRRALVLALLIRVVVTHDQLTLHFDLQVVRAIAEQQPLRDVLQQRHDNAHNPQDTDTVTTPVRLCHVRGGLKLVLGDGRRDEPQPDATLIKLLKKAHAYLERVMNTDVDMSMKALAAQAEISESTFTAVLRLAWLAPDITQALMEGRHPPELNASHLIKQSRNLPLEWTHQRQLLKRTPASSRRGDR